MKNQLLIPTKCVPRCRRSKQISFGLGRPPIHPVIEASNYVGPLIGFRPYSNHLASEQLLRPRASGY